MTLTASEVASLANKLFWWELAEYFFAALVTIGCLGEYIAEFTNWFTGEDEISKKRMEKRATLLLVGALALELVCLVKTNQLSGRVIGSLNELTTGADTKARKALGDSGDAIMQARDAKTEADTANKSSGKAVESASIAMTLARGARQEADAANSQVAKIRERIADRHLTVEQQARIRGKLARFSGTRLVFALITPDGEMDGLINDLMSTFPITFEKKLGWRTCILRWQASPGFSGMRVELTPEASQSDKDFAVAFVSALSEEHIEITGPVPMPQRSGSMLNGCAAIPENDPFSLMHGHIAISRHL
jgi:hypothetical protein